MLSASWVPCLDALGQLIIFCLIAAHDLCWEAICIHTTNTGTKTELLNVCSRCAFETFGGRCFSHFLPFVGRSFDVTLPVSPLCRTELSMNPYQKQNNTTLECVIFCLIIRNIYVVSTPASGTRAAKAFGISWVVRAIKVSCVTLMRWLKSHPSSTKDGELVTRGNDQKVENFQSHPLNLWGGERAEGLINHPTSCPWPRI